MHSPKAAEQIADSFDGLKGTVEGTWMIKSKRMLSFFFVIALLLSLMTSTAFATTAEGTQGRRIVKFAYPIQKYLSEVDESGNYYG